MVSLFYASRLAFRKMLCLSVFLLVSFITLSGQGGVTVIVHGFQLYGTIEDGWITFAQGIQLKKGSNAVILKNDPNTGEWKKPNGIPNPQVIGANTELILIYDWSGVSNDIDKKGGLEAAADQLFAMLVSPNGVPSTYSINLLTTNKYKHFIGHSRGCILLLQVLRRMAKNFPPTPTTTNKIDRLTTLDPHPAVGLGCDDPSLWGVNSNTAFDYQILIPSNVKVAENYFRREFIFPYELTYNFGGVPALNASLDRRLDNTKLKQGCSSFTNGSAHSNVHAWYYGTINLSPTIYYGSCTDNQPNNNWWTPEKRDTSGYNAILSNEVVGATSAALEAGKAKLNVLFNGGFEYGTYGWKDYGGQILARQVSNGVATLDINPTIHSYMLFSENDLAGKKNEYLCFSAKCISSRTSVTANLKIIFYDSKGQNPLPYKIEHIVLKNDGYTNLYCQIPKTLKNKVGKFSVESYPTYYGQGNPVGTIGSNIIIDNFFLSNTATNVELRASARTANQVTTESITSDYSNYAAFYRDSSENNFTNLPNNAWYKSYAQDGAGYGLFEGDAYNSFNAYESVTRGEATAIIVNSALKLNILRGGNLNISTTNGLFSDVPEDHQYFPYIQALRNLGYLNINASNTFNPDDNLTLGQFCKLLSLTYWDNITPPATTLPNVNRTASQFNVIIPPNTNPDFAPHISKILNTFTAKTRGSKRWAERIFNFKLNASSSGYDNVIDANVVLDRASMIKAMTNVFEFRRNELANAADVSNFITLGEKWELPTNTVGLSANFSTINDVDLRMIAGTQISLNATIPNLDNPHFYWSINGGTLTPNNAAVNFNIVNFTAPLVTVTTTLTLYVYAGSTSGRAVEIVKNIIVDPVGTPTRDSVDVKFRVSLKGTGRKVHPTGMRITGALGAFTQPDWTPSAAAIMVLESPTRDSIYTTTIKIPRRVAPNDVYEFKYVNGDEWGDGSNNTPEDERNLTHECGAGLYYNRFFLLTPLPATAMILPCYQFNTCTVYTQSVLSVEFISLNVTHKNGVNNIVWQTASEKNSDHFDIERSTDGKQFVKIGEVKAFGSTNQVQNYTYLDASLPPQYNLFYYRLRQVDMDNKAEYSPIRSIQIDKQDKNINIYPNPTTGQFTLELADNTRLNNAKVTIFNILGQRIAEQTFSDKKMLLDLSNHPQGTYFVKLKTENGVEVTQKIQKF